MAKKNTKSKAKAGSLSGDNFTLEQVAIECIHFETENEVVKQSKNTLSDHFLSAASIYIKDVNTTGEDMASDHPFLVACDAQEKISKSEQAGINQWDKIPRSWSQLKSNVKAAYNMGLDINSYTTESSMRKDLNEARKAAKEANKTPEELAAEQVESALDVLTESGNTALSQRLFAITEQCKNVTDSQADDILRILDEALENIMVMKELAAQFNDDIPNEAVA